MHCVPAFVKIYLQLFFGEYMRLWLRSLQSAGLVQSRLGCDVVCVCEAIQSIGADGVDCRVVNVGEIDLPVELQWGRKWDTRKGLRAARLRRGTFMGNAIDWEWGWGLCFNLLATEKKCR
jgi:hypothetical protein